MKGFKKLMSVLLVMGLLSAGTAVQALADTAADGPIDRPRGGWMMSSTELNDLISGLSAEEQSTILSLQSQLEALRPQRQEPTDEEKATLASYQSQIKALEDEIKAILAAEGVTLDDPTQGAPNGQRPPKDSAPDAAEPPAQPTDAQNGTELPAKAADNLSQDTDAAARPQPRNGAGIPQGGRTLKLDEATLSQLSADAQTQIASLTQQISDLQSQLRDALGQQKPQQQELTDEEKAAQEANRQQIQALEEELKNALQAAGLELPQSPQAPAKNNDEQ